MPNGTKTSGGGTTVTGHREVIKLSNGSLYDSSDRQMVESIDYRETTGENIPDYHKLKKAGKLLPHTNFHQYEVKGQGSSYYSVYEGNPDKLYHHTWDTWLNTDGVSPWPTQTELTAYFQDSGGNADFYIQQAMADVYGNGYDVLTSLVELHEVRDLFLSISQKLSEVVKDPKTLKRLWRKLEKGRGLDILTSEWLTYRYGIRTLIYDLVGLVEAIESYNDKRTRFSERAGNTFSLKETKVEYGEFGSSHNLLTTTDKVEVSTRGSVTVDIVVPRFQLNVVQTAWEYTRLSFVLDWLYSVGNAIQAASARALASDYVASGGYQVKCSRHSLLEPISWKSPYQHGENHYMRVYESEAVLQERWPAEVPLLPQVALRLNKSKILDILALVYQGARGGGVKGPGQRI